VTAGQTLARLTLPEARAQVQARWPG